MARPRRWEHGDGRCIVAAPFGDDLLAVMGEDITMAEYQARCERRFADFADLGRYRPDCKSVVTHAGDRPSRGTLQDGDTLLCACARPDSPKRTHPCHLEWLAPFLKAAGWAVVLYGETL